MAPNFGWKNEFIPKFLKIQPETKVKRGFTRSIKSPIEFTESPIDSSESSGSFFESSVSFISSGTSLESSTHFKATGSSISNTGTFVGDSRSSATIFESSGYSSTYFSTLISPESSFKSKAPIDSELFGSSYGSFVPLDSFGSSGPILKKSAIEPFGLTSATVLKAKANSSWEDSRMFPTDLIGNTLIEMVASANTEHPEIPVAVVNKIDYGIRMNAATLVMNASSVNATDFPYVPDLFYRHSLAMTAVYCVAYLLVFAVGLVGNCFVIAVVFRSPRMRTVTNFFIVNLAVADILVIIFCLPATLMSNIFVPWVLGWWMCKTVPYVQGVSVAASVYSLIAVSLDRFLAIWWPLKCQITKRRARLMIFIIWVIALTTTIPWALFFDLVVIFSDAPDIQLCLEVWPDALNGALYFLIANLLFCYILPMILITMCYILIWIKVWKRHIPTDTKDAQMERMQQKSKVKVVKMLVAVVILFVVSWLPLYVIFARIKLGKDIAQWEEEILPIATPIAQWLGASNSCINPILYAFFNKKYRRGFMAIVKSRRCCGRLRYYETVAMMSSSTSMRKSSHYFNNNNSSTRRVPPDTAVSYIYNNTGV